MRIFAISDIHIDYDENRKWVFNLSQNEYKKDILIVAGDVTDDLSSLKHTFEALKNRFMEVFFVPGNHDLWVRQNNEMTSMEKYWQIRNAVDDFHVHMKPMHFPGLVIVPLLGWYDYSFGQPSDELMNIWADFFACKWGKDLDENAITNFFIAENNEYTKIKSRFVISFSHFLPRIDLMPSFIPQKNRVLYPVLGTSKLEKQIRELNSKIHIYGHSHVNRRVTLNDTLYLNNAFGYPHEILITKKEMICVFDSEL